MAKRLAAAGAALALLALAAYALIPADPTGAAPEGRRIAVETTPIGRGTLVDRREFPGSLEAAAEFTVAPKVGGRVEAMLADIGDRVARGDVVVRLDDAEYRQAVTQAEAELAVARAQRREARSNRTLAERRLERVRRLRERGIAAASELDEAETEAAAQTAATAVAEAQVTRARAALEAAQVRLGYTRIAADWPGAGEARVVGERLVDTGDTVAANTAMLTILDIRRLKAVIRVPEDVYAGVAPGQQAEVRASALPGRVFPATVARIAPRFDTDSRQARVELTVDNPERALVPGMFVQVAVAAGRVEDAPLLPATALVERGGRTGVFVLAPEADTARFVPVDVALRADGRAALAAPGDLDGDVVVLGQNQLEDGTAVVRADTDDGDA
ncbi:RND family efflux transporter MFP subunit [Salinisphaera sp. PC39]|uniref:efflux RND transporter periplasmic adaptor subunit n=1 Tax=Salinisphaera sp. PC39 TaxID=1304156 RepID=UPI00333E2BB2